VGSGRERCVGIRASLEQAHVLACIAYANELSSGKFVDLAGGNAA